MSRVLKISKILVGIDGSECSIRVFEFAKDLARKYNFQIIAFTAFNIPDLYKIYEKKEEGLNVITKFYDTKLPPDLAISEYAESEGADHIVVGSRGRSIENLLIGNIATSIVKISKCSVTVIK